ncbi:hypothetical protein, partial [Vibrio methylphosphonaticus]|uniref:hypothetical protein n=1 Tax=Vibrio methylphosphonaticus TaxID=2946866 RepID=UPI00202A7534
MLNRRLFFVDSKQHNLPISFISYGCGLGVVQWYCILIAVCSLPLSWFVLGIILEKSLAHAMQQQLPILFQQAAVNSFDAHALVLKSEASLKALIEGVSFHHHWLGAVVKHVNVLEISLNLKTEVAGADVNFMFDQRDYAVHWSLDVVWEQSKLLLLILFNPVLVTLLILLLWRGYKEGGRTTRLLFETGSGAAQTAIFKESQALTADEHQALTKDDPQTLNIPEKPSSSVQNDATGVMSSNASNEPVVISKTQESGQSLAHQAAESLAYHSQELQFEPATQSVVIDDQRIV